MYVDINGEKLMQTTSNPAVDKTAEKTATEKAGEKLAEKRRALGRGLESLLPLSLIHI